MMAIIIKLNDCGVCLWHRCRSAAASVDSCHILVCFHWRYSADIVVTFCDIAESCFPLDDIASRYSQREGCHGLGFPTKSENRLGYKGISIDLGSQELEKTAMIISFRSRRVRGCDVLVGILFSRQLPEKTVFSLAGLATPCGKQFVFYRGLQRLCLFGKIE